MDCEWFLLILWSLSKCTDVPGNISIIELITICLTELNSQATQDFPGVLIVVGHLLDSFLLEEIRNEHHLKEIRLYGTLFGQVPIGKYLLDSSNEGAIESLYIKFISLMTESIQCPTALSTPGKPCKRYYLFSCLRQNVRAPHLWTINSICRQIHQHQPTRNHS